MKRIVIPICNFLSLASTCKITAHQPEQRMKRKDLAAMNRQDIRNDLLQCFTVAHIRRLQEVLCLCASDFEGQDFVDFLNDIEAREVMLQMIQDVYGDVPARFADMMCEIPYAGFDELQMLMVYCKRYRARFTLLEWQEIEIQYKYRMQRLSSMAKPRTHD